MWTGEAHPPHQVVSHSDSSTQAVVTAQGVIHPPGPSKLHFQTLNLKVFVLTGFSIPLSLLRILAVITAVIPSTNSVTTSPPPHQWLVAGLLRGSEVVCGEVNEQTSNTFLYTTD